MIDDLYFSDKFFDFDEYAREEEDLRKPKTQAATPHENATSPSSAEFFSKRKASKQPVLRGGSLPRILVLQDQGRNVRRSSELSLNFRNRGSTMAGSEAFLVPQTTKNQRL